MLGRLGVGRRQGVNILARVRRRILEQPAQALLAPLDDGALHHEATQNELSGKVEPAIGQ
jgi:hypothetical protein